MVTSMMLESKANNTQQTDANLKNQGGTAEKFSNGGCDKQEMPPCNDPNRPMSPPSASSIFTEEAFKRYFRDNPAAVDSIADKIAAYQWESAMSNAEKALDEEMAKKMRSDYDKEMLARNKQSGGIHVGEDEESDESFNVVNEEDASDEFSSYEDEDEDEDEDGDGEDEEYVPKNPPKPYFLFMQEFKKEFKRDNPDNKSIAVVDRAASAKWFSMSDTNKAPYLEMAEKMQNDYNKNMEANCKKLDETHMREEDKSDDSLSFDDSLSSYEEHEEESDKGERDMPRLPLFLVEAPKIPELRATKLTQGESPGTPVVAQPEVSATALNSFERISSEVEKVSSLPSFSSRFQPHRQRVAIEDQLQSLRGLAQLSLSDIVRNGKLSELTGKLKLRQVVNRQHKFEVLLLLLDGLGANLPEEIECMDSVDSAPRKESCLQQTVLDQFKELNSNKDNLNAVQVQIDELKVQLKALEARKSSLSNDWSIILTDLEKSVEDLKLLKQKPVPTPEEYNKAKAIVDVIDRAWETAMANPW